MEPLLLLAGGAAVLWIAKQSKTAAPLASNQDNPNLPVVTNQPAPATSVSSSPLATVPIVGTIVSGIQAGAKIGAAVDLALNPNTNRASQQGAKVLGSVAVVTLSVAAILVAILPVFAPFILAATAIILAVVAAVYTLWVWVDDIHALQYGQGGARKDYLKQYTGFVQSLQSSIAQQGSNPPMSQVQIDRIIVPFAEGYMARLNYTAYQALMATRQFNVQTDLSALFPISIGTAPNLFPAMPAAGKGYLPGTTVMQTADSLWDQRWGYDRGKFVGADCDTVATGARTWDDPPGWRSGNGVGGGRQSTDQAWILEHTPPDELVSIDAPTLLTKLWGSDRASSVLAWYKDNAIPILPFFVNGVWIFVSYPIGTLPNLSDANTLAAIKNVGTTNVIPGGLIAAGGVYSVFNKSGVITVGGNPAILTDIQTMQNYYPGGNFPKYQAAALDAQTLFNKDAQSVTAPNAVTLTVDVKAKIAACLAADTAGKVLGKDPNACANALNLSYTKFTAANVTQPPPNWQFQQVSTDIDSFNQANVAIPKGPGILKSGVTFTINGQEIYKVYQTYYFQDKNNTTYFSAGFVYANFILYRNAAMNASPPGDIATLRTAMVNKAFEGTLNSDASLTYAGNTYHWNAPLS